MTKAEGLKRLAKQSNVKLAKSYDRYIHAKIKVALEVVERVARQGEYSTCLEIFEPNNDIFREILHKLKKDYGFRFKVKNRGSCWVKISWR